MSDTFDKDFWEAHWNRGSEVDNRLPPANPYLDTELADVTPGTALDAGCGEGAEAIWLAAHGWSVTGVDIATQALQRANDRATATGEQVEWVEADLSTWQPEVKYDLVTTFYAHPTIPQLDFYKRIAEWVSPGGTLLIVGHLHTDAEGHHPGWRPPSVATATAADVRDLFDPTRWRINTAEARTRALHDPMGGRVTLDDVVLRATRPR